MNFNIFIIMFISSYLYNLEKGAKHDLAASFAYATSSLTFSFVVMCFGGFVSIFMNSAVFFDDYVFFAGGLSILYLYLFYMFVQMIYFNFFGSIESTIARYENDLWLKKNSGILHLLPLTISGFLLLFLASYI